MPSPRDKSPAAGVIPPRLLAVPCFFLSPESLGFNAGDFRHSICIHVNIQLQSITHRITLHVYIYTYIYIYILYVIRYLTTSTPILQKNVGFFWFDWVKTYVNKLCTWTWWSWTGSSAGGSAWYLTTWRLVRSRIRLQGTHISHLGEKENQLQISKVRIC